MTQTHQAIAYPSNSISSSLMLQVAGVNVYYGESHILRDVDLSVPVGQMVCLIGRNGVGKTTLLKTIMGLLKPRTGTITLSGEPITDKSPDKRARLGIGYVPQGREIIPRLTVKENLLLGLEARPSGRKGNEEVPEEIFSLFPVLKSMLVSNGWGLEWGTTTATCDRTRFNGKT
jgi:urea transport system ATP-binding protein